VYLGELKPKSGRAVPLALEEPEKLVVLPELEVAWSKKKLILSILT